MRAKDEYRITAKGKLLCLKVTENKKGTLMKVCEMSVGEGNYVVQRE